MDALHLVIGSLGVWRVTHLLHAEDGPWDALVWVRRQAGAGFFGSLLDCFYCLSLWVAAPFALLLGDRWAGRFLAWLALSGAAILLERFTARAEGPPPAIYQEEVDDELLRQRADRAPGDSTSGPDP